MSWGSQVGCVLTIVWLAGENTLAVWSGCQPNAVHHTHPPPGRPPHCKSIGCSRRTEGARARVDVREQTLCLGEAPSLFPFILRGCVSCNTFQPEHDARKVDSADVRQQEDPEPQQQVWGLYLSPS